ncbi:MAG: hypothetical protein KDD61_05320 [Bdellovibrionales bacterium]|nr:hypothetical protein [Bdellovibrionales bacterium]
MDLEVNKPLVDLVNIPIGSRDWEWEKSFFQALVNGNVNVMMAEPQTGPDGWPYMFVETSLEATEPSLKLMQWISERGIGLALNVQKTQPDFVFSYGMIWSYRETAQFIVNPGETVTNEIEFQKGESIYAQNPSEQYLPKYARAILRKFLEDQGIKEPKFLLVSQDLKQFDLCFSLESLGNPPKEEHTGIAEALSWFLPTHYSIVLVSEKAFSKSFFLV